MQNLIPVNNHLLIEPLKLEGFIASERETYQEIGVVVKLPQGVALIEGFTVSPGDKVYFDSWLAKKYPKEGSTSEFYWLVKWEDVSAIQYGGKNPETDGPTQ